MEMRSRARLRLSRTDEAVADAVDACRLCRYRPEAWDALAEAAEAAGDLRTTALALTELLYLQPAAAPNLPTPVANARREQAFRLAALRAGKLADGGGSALLQSMKRSNRPRAAGPPSRSADTTAAGGGGQGLAAGGSGSADASPAQPPADPAELARSAVAAAIFVDEYAIIGEEGVEGTAAQGQGSDPS